MYTGINASDIKERNRGLLLRLLCCEGVDSRIEMAKRSGLSKMAVTNITAQLIQDGWLEETHLTETNRVGRNPMGLALSASSPRVLGLYLSRKQVTAVLADACCTILHRETAVLEEGEDPAGEEEGVEVLPPPQADRVPIRRDAPTNSARNFFCFIINLLSKCAV